MYTGDFGTSARHPARERVESPISKSLPREGVAALPYTENLTSAQHPSSKTTAHSCTGGHGGPPLRRGFVVDQAFQITREVL